MDTPLTIFDSLYVRGRGAIACAKGPGNGLGKGAILEQRRSGVLVREVVVACVEFTVNLMDGRNSSERWGILLAQPDVPVEDLKVGDTLHVRVSVVPDVLLRPSSFTAW